MSAARRANLPKVPALDGALERALEQVRLRAHLRALWLAWLRRDLSETTELGSFENPDLESSLSDRDNPKDEASWLAENADAKKLQRRLATLEGAKVSAAARLLRFEQLFGLGEAERSVLYTCLAVNLDPSLALVFGALQTGRPAHPTEPLVARLFGFGRCLPWTSQSSLRLWSIIEEIEIAPGEPRALQLDPHILAWLTGIDGLDPVLVDVADFKKVEEPLQGWPVGDANDFLERVSRDASSARIVISGAIGSGRGTFAALIASCSELPLLVIDSDAVDEQEWPQVFLRAQRQAFLTGSALAWRGQHALENRWPTSPSLFPIQFSLVERGQLPRSSGELVDQHLSIPPLSLTERAELWRRFVPGAKKWPEDEFGVLVRRQRVTIGDIHSVARRRPRSAGDATEAIRAASRDRLGKLARRIEPSLNWNDLALPDFLRKQLRFLIFEVGERGALLEEPELRRLFPPGPVLTLMSGPSGCGKTASAQVVAAELGMDIFAISIASIVSKWVGETPKNIDLLLNRAADLDAVLLFDEADALFKERSPDAHGHTSSGDTAHLLTAIESYPGIAILCTNRKKDIDPSFIRRIRHELDFAPPEPKERRILWQQLSKSLVGEKAQERLVFFLDVLADQIQITGAQIKNAVLNATLEHRRLCAEFDKANPGRKKGRPLFDKVHLVDGLELELRKHGRAMNRRDRERLLAHD